jgi:hypothetical protein
MGEEEELVERPDPILHYLRNYYISHTDRETLLESATVSTTSHQEYVDPAPPPPPGSSKKSPGKIVIIWSKS